MSQPRFSLDMVLAPGGAPLALAGGSGYVEPLLKLTSAAPHHYKFERSQCDLHGEFAYHGKGTSKDNLEKLKPCVVVFSAQSRALFTALVLQVWRKPRLDRNLYLCRVRNAGYVYRLPDHVEQGMAAAWEMRVALDHDERPYFRDWCFSVGWEERAESLEKELRILSTVQQLGAWRGK